MVALETDPLLWERVVHKHETYNEWDASWMIGVRVSKFVSVCAFKHSYCRFFAMFAVCTHASVKESNATCRRLHSGCPQQRRLSEQFVGPGVFARVREHAPAPSVSDAMNSVIHNG